MLFSKARREKLFEVDARWPLKIGVRMLLNVICIFSIICAVSTVSHSSPFSPKPFAQARAVLVYVPCDGITIAWNMINITYLLGRKKAFSNVTNVMVHFFLGVGFAIIGIYVTVLTWNAKKQLATDPYGLDGDKDKTMTSITGHNITVNSLNVDTCPAFPNCIAQGRWEEHASIRALVSVIGCVLFDIAFFLHVVFFLWCCNDTVFGLRGRSQRKQEKEERERRRLEEMDEVPSPRTSVINNKTFDTEARPARHIHRSRSATSLRTQTPVRPLMKSRSAQSLNSARPLYKSRSAQSLNSQRRYVANRPRISGPTLQHHVSYDIKNSTYSVYTPNSERPSLVLKPTSGSREALSLSIFENPHSNRPMSTESTLFDVSTSSTGNRVDNRTSHLSLQPIPEPEAALTERFDFSQQPHPRYTYYRGASSPAVNALSAGGPSQPNRVRHLSTGDLDSVEEDFTALPQKDHFFNRRSQLNSPQRRKSGLRNVTNISGL